MYDVVFIAAIFSRKNAISVRSTDDRAKEWNPRVKKSGHSKRGLLSIRKGCNTREDSYSFRA